MLHPDPLILAELAGAAHADLMLEIVLPLVNKRPSCNLSTVRGTCIGGYFM
jgi:hypothetical protein